MCPRMAEVWLECQGAGKWDQAVGEPGWTRESLSARARDLGPRPLVTWSQKGS